MTHREQQYVIVLPLKMFFFYKTHRNLILSMTSVEEMLEQDVVVTVLWILVTMPLLCVGLQVHNQGRGEAG